MTTGGSKDLVDLDVLACGDKSGQDGLFITGRDWDWIVHAADDELDNKESLNVKASKVTLATKKTYLQ